MVIYLIKVWTDHRETENAIQAPGHDKNISMNQNKQFNLNLTLVMLSQAVITNIWCILGSFLPLKLALLGQIEEN